VSKNSPMFAALQLSLICLALVAGVHASPIEPRSVWTPHIKYPHRGTVWHIGEAHNVKWIIDDCPPTLTNPVGEVRLRKNGNTLPEPLAAAFDLRSGSIAIQVPNVPPGDDYQLVLFGDSGNFSPSFTILHPLSAGDPSLTLLALSLRMNIHPYGFCIIPLVVVVLGIFMLRKRSDDTRWTFHKQNSSHADKNPASP